MSILSWNCRGAGNTETNQFLRELRRKYFPDFMFLMETKQKLGYMKGLQESLGYDKLLTVEPEGLSGGLAVMWKQSYVVDVLFMNNRIIDLRVKMGSTVFFLSCVYGDPVRDRRQQVWDHLTSIGLMRNEAWTLVGDFNELLSNNEKLGGAVRHESTFWRFRSMVENCKLKEIRSVGNSLSWAGWRDRVWVQCRLDRSFGNDEWFHLFPRAQAEYLDLWASDHRPILLCFALESDCRGRGRFYFDKRMVDQPGVEEIIKKGWTKRCDNSDPPLMDRIAYCRRELSQWKRRSNQNSHDKIAQLRQSLEREITKYQPNAATMRHLRTELSRASHAEEIFWRQRSKEQWLKHGDKNTPFYQNSVKGRKLHNKVLMLKDELNRETFSEGAKGEIAVNYFRELFMSSNPYDLDSVFEGFEGKVTPEMNSLLLAHVSDEEIMKAVFTIKGSSAPGEDGLTGVFYKKFWHIVGPTVCEEVRSFFETAILPAGWNHTQLCMIPKVSNPTEMKDMRPISLCSVHYKIVSKILCGRLKQVLPSLISATQGAFVSGRLITDNVIVAHEMVHGLRTKESVEGAYMVVKTDMSKAYDRVEWSFLETLMEKMQFDRTWIRWVMSCVSSVSYSVLLNGRSHGFIRPERGIRQGDPLSPFLFIMCAEALVSCLNHSETRGRIHGIQLTPHSPSVHHLLFADDSLLMCRANAEESREIMTCLSLYGEASGQCINLQKSSIIFGAKVADNIRAEVKGILGIEKEGGDGSYLGLPECFKGSKKDLLNFIREKLHGRLNGWFSKALSQGGKEILLKSICLSLPVYAMSVFKLPKDLCNKLTSAMVEFWWSSGNNRKKIPWVAWQKLCRRKEEGGLGFHDISRFNQALLGKQAWRIWNNPESLVARVLKARYFHKSSFLDCGSGTRPSYAWRSILHGREILRQGLVRSIGNGIDTNVWAHNWLIDPIPRSPMYREGSVVDLTLTVADLLIPNTALWDISKVRRTFTATDADLILKLKPVSSRCDSNQWGFTKTGKYTSKSGYRLLESLSDSRNPQHPHLSPVERKLWRDIWKIKTLPKIRHLFWKALAGALAVKDRLASRGLQLDTTCQLCGEASESISHTLFNCPIAKEVWLRTQLPFPPAGFSLNSMFLNIYHLVACMKNKHLDERSRRAYPWVLWHIWKARNSFVFEKGRLSPTTIVDQAFEDADIWFKVNDIDTTASVSDGFHGWTRPPSGLLKCNIAASWSPHDCNSGAAWILRDCEGQVAYHSRRSFAQVRSQAESELHALHWAVESIRHLQHDNIIFESELEGAREILLSPPRYPAYQSLTLAIQQSLSQLHFWSLEHVRARRNQIAQAIAISVIRYSKLQSYIASGGPLWLHTRLTLERVSSAR